MQTLDHTDSSHYRNENRLAIRVILEIFERFRFTIDRPEYSGAPNGAFWEKDLKTTTKRE